MDLETVDHLQIAPHIEPYFSDGSTDDLAGVIRSYRVPERGVRGLLYALTTSTGMMAIVLALLGGVLGGVLPMVVGIEANVAFGVGAACTVVIFAVTVVAAGRYFVRDQSSLEVRFPSAPAVPAADGSWEHRGGPG